MPVDYAPLQIIHIYFDTWTRTFDQVERDAKTTLNAMLGVIGGTMGLLTGTAQAHVIVIFSSSQIYFQGSPFSVG